VDPLDARTPHEAFDTLLVDTDPFTERELLHDPGAAIVAAGLGVDLADLFAEQCVRGRPRRWVLETHAPITRTRRGDLEAPTQHLDWLMGLLRLDEGEGHFER